MQQEWFQESLSSLAVPVAEQELIQYADTYTRSADTEILFI